MQTSTFEEEAMYGFSSWLVGPTQPGVWTLERCQCECLVLLGLIHGGLCSWFLETQCSLRKWEGYIWPWLTGLGCAPGQVLVGYGCRFMLDSEEYLEIQI
jgi:hypothetical protein